MTPAPDPASVTVAVSILAPAYNEEAVIRTFAEAVLRDIPLGWHPGNDLEANRIGWEEGLAYVRKSPLSMLDSIHAGTIEMLGSPECAPIWSTQEAVPGAFLEWSPRYVPLQTMLYRVLIVGAAVLLILAAASLLTWRSWPRNLIIIGIGIPFLSWFGHTVLFFGPPRFRYTIETILAILVAVSLVALKEGARHGVIAQQVTHGGAVDAPVGDA